MGCLKLSYYQPLRVVTATKADSEFTNADFDGSFTAPLELLSKKGREEIKESFTNFEENIKAIADNLPRVPENTYKAAIKVVDNTVNKITETIGNLTEKPEDIIDFDTEGYVIVGEGKFLPFIPDYEEEGVVENFEGIVLKGENGSSLTIKTELLSLNVDGSSLLGDLGGNYTLEGKESLQLTADIGGFFDPSPTLDLFGASLSAESGDYWGAGASLLGAGFPLIGDFAKGPKIIKAINKIKEVADKGVKKIGPAGDAGATVTKQVPSNWTIKTSKKGNGTKFTDPQNPGANNVRVQGGKPKSPNPAQQNPYVKQTKNGQTVDVNENPVPSNSAEAHIPKKDFKYKKD